MTNNDESSVSAAAESRTDRALRAYLRAVILAEPVQLALLQRHGVRLFDLRALRILLDLGEVPTSRLAEVLEIPRSTATGLIDRLEERRFIKRVASRTDRRVILIRVTEQGRLALENREILEESLAGRAIAALPPDQQEALAVLLERLIAEARAQNRAALEPTIPVGIE
ncbi:MAG TPA: MarR family transcriptional regulator [Thermomicrobiaceae bacterium]|nr:MarR family transcriptional regulator [Thermomicrobiaceae bacterium]